VVTTVPLPWVQAMEISFNLDQGCQSCRIPCRWGTAALCSQSVVTGSAVSQCPKQLVSTVETRSAFGKVSKVKVKLSRNRPWRPIGL
jgi:hypothetical protein